MNEHHDPDRPIDPALTPPDERAADRATGDAPRERGDTLNSAQRDDAQRTAAALQAGLTPHSEMPRDLRDRLLADGLALVQARNPLMEPPEPGAKRSAWMPVALAASILIAVGAGIVGAVLVGERNAQLETQRELVADLRQRIGNNQTLLTNAQTRVLELRSRVATLDETATTRERELAELLEREARLAARGTRLAEQLADATENLALLREDLEDARLTIARYETPVDPETLRANREKLLEVPGTVRLAWSPFNLPDAPAPEQPEVTGDVVWNDELETGYLRFVGLDPNDPNIEQYQVWVIDERGMEQKVSGGVFDVTDAGEVIVPIEPGIEVGRVALFAVTVENPGGTWVPDLERRIVVAPREDQG